MPGSPEGSGDAVEVVRPCEPEPEIEFVGDVEDEPSITFSATLEEESKSREQNGS